MSLIDTLTGQISAALLNSAQTYAGVAGAVASQVDALFFRGVVVAIDDLAPDCTIQEDLTDSVTVTDHPVEIGAAVTDHAFINPSEVTMRLAWTQSKGFLASVLGASSPSPTEAYERLRELMDARDPIDILTTARAYENMVITGLGVRRDSYTANILDITVKLRQVILVSTSTVALKPEAQAVPAQTMSVENAGSKLPAPVKESVLSTIGGIFE